MHPKFRHFAAPFVITVAAACGSPQPSPEPIHINPPAPAADAGAELSPADAALPDMPERRDPISGDPDPGASLAPVFELGPAARVDTSEPPPLITANPPRQPSSHAMVIALEAATDGVVVTVNRGSAHGLEVGFTARVLDRDGALLGEMRLTKVMTSRSIGKLTGITMARAKAAYTATLARP